MAEIMAMSSPAVARRTAGAADDPFLRALYASTRSDLAAAALSPEAHSQLCDLQWNAQHVGYAAQYPNARHDILELGGVPIGRLIVDERDGSLALIDIALLPQYRGRGLGDGLLRVLQAEARTIVLHVEAGNPARRLYERRGFVAIAEQGLHTEMVWTA